MNAWPDLCLPLNIFLPTGHKKPTGEQRDTQNPTTPDHHHLSKVKRSTRLVGSWPLSSMSLRLQPIRPHVHAAPEQGMLL